MKVYIVVCGSTDNHQGETENLGVFSTKDKAIKYIETLKPKEYKKVIGKWIKELCGDDIFTEEEITVHYQWVKEQTCYQSNWDNDYYAIQELEVDSE